MPGLLGSQQIARAANLQITHRDLETRAEHGKTLQRVQPLHRYFRQRLVLWQHQINNTRDVCGARPCHGVGGDSARPKRSRIIDDHCVRGRDVDA